MLAAKMNLAIRGIESDLGPHAADSFHEALHPDLKANFLLANPPFNMSDWGGELLEDEPGFCASANLEKIDGHNYVLTPGRYVGFAEEDDDDEPFEEKIARLTATLETQFAKSTRLKGQPPLRGASGRRCYLRRGCS